MRTLRACAIIFLASIIFSCGSHQRTLTAHQGASFAPANTAQPQAQTLSDALAQLDALPVPDGVKPEVFLQLKAALREALTCRAGTCAPPSGDSGKADHGGPRVAALQRIVSTPPTGDANRVKDLAIADNGDGTYSLTWHYRNLGDYNQDGTVGVSDITPLAIHYNETANPSNEWIDGNGNGKVDISDVTLIAINFAIQVDHYTIEASDAADSGFTPVAMCQIPEADNLSRLSIPYSLGATPAYTYWRIAPVDASGAQGDYSNVAQVGDEYLAISIDTPADAATFTVGNSTTFSATVTDDVAITQVKFFIKGSLYYTDTAAPWEAPEYTFTSDDIGQVVFAATATNADNATASDMHTVTVNPASGNPPAAPSNLEATTASSTQINLQWQDNSSDEDGFRIERKEGAAGTWTEIAQAAADATSYPDTGLLASTTYYYRVRAYNIYGLSSYSGEATATTQSGGGSAEVENNDSTSQANQLYLPVSGLTGNVGPGGYDGDENDYFKFTCGDKSLLNISINFNNATGDVFLYLLDSSGSTIYVADNGSPPRSFTWGLTAGTYYLRVRAWTGYSDYTIDASLSTPGYDETEDNDATSTANVLPLPVTDYFGHVGQFGYNGDENDFFKFTCNDKSLLNISINYNNATGDVFLYLLDSSGSTIYVADNGSPPRSFTWGFTAGTYYLRVRAWTGYSDYMIDASLSSPGYDETEDNDATSTANVLSLPVTDYFGHAGQFGYNGDDSDYLKFTLSSANSVTITLDYDNSEGELLLYLLDSGGSTISSDTDGNTGQRTITESLSNGTYYIRVRAWMGQSAYFLDVT